MGWWCCHHSPTCTWLVHVPSSLLPPDVWFFIVQCPLEFAICWRHVGVFHSICWRPYHVECTGSLLTSEVKRHRARLVLGWGTAWEDPRVLSAFFATAFGIRVMSEWLGVCSCVWACVRVCVCVLGFVCVRACVFECFRSFVCLSVGPAPPPRGHRARPSPPPRPHPAGCVGRAPERSACYGGGEDSLAHTPLDTHRVFRRAMLAAARKHAAS